LLETFTEEQFDALNYEKRRWFGADHHFEF